MRGNAGRRFMLAAALAVCATLPGVLGRAADRTAPTFDAGHVLPGQGGGEPSIAVDLSPTHSRGAIYVTAVLGWGPNPPPGDPAGAGAATWHSYDGGSTWSQAADFDTGVQDSQTGDADADVTVLDNGDVVVADLNISYAWVQVSTDHGQSFDAGIPTGYEDDRPWLSHEGGTVYLVYHDLALEVPIVCVSTDGGHSFPVCNPLTLAGRPGVAAQCAENTVAGRALEVDPTDGSLNFLVGCSTDAEDAAHPPWGQDHDWYLAKSTDGGLTWSDYPVFIADLSGGRQPTYDSIMGRLRIDSQGNYYAVFAGTADETQVASNPYHVYLATSTLHGRRWSAPRQVDQGTEGTNVQPDLAVTAPGNVDIAYYRVPVTGEPNGYCGYWGSQLLHRVPCVDGFARFDNPHPAPPLLAPPSWEVDMAQATDALDAHPTFTRTTVARDVHVGEICTNLLACGDRSMLDFLSMAVDCNGLAHIAFAGNTVAEEAADFVNGGADVHEVDQSGGTRLAAPSACSQTHQHAPPHPLARPAPAPARRLARPIRSS